MREPCPGDWIPAEEFAEVIRLTPLVAIDLIVSLPDRRVLLGRRTHEPARGVLFVPGSRVTKNETLAAAFRRVSREELGLELEIGSARFLGVFEHFYRANRFENAGFGTHYVTLAYEVFLQEPPPSLPHDQHGEYFWLTPEAALTRDDVHHYTKTYFRCRAEFAPSPGPASACA